MLLCHGFLDDVEGLSGEEYIADGYNNRINTG
jgi:hypothetical protein